MFQSTPSGGKATGLLRYVSGRVLFQSTPSGGKATSVAYAAAWDAAFQSTPSGGKATSVRVFPGVPAQFQSTPSGGKATLVLPGALPPQHVSIHAFRGEGDPSPAQTGCCCSGFNPRLPGGRRQDRINASRVERGFQSTPSGGKATYRMVRDALEHGDVSIHAFRGEGDFRHRVQRLLCAVSIHAFRGEGDPVLPPC